LDAIAVLLSQVGSCYICRPGSLFTHNDHQAPVKVRSQQLSAALLISLVWIQINITMVQLLLKKQQKTAKNKLLWLPNTQHCEKVRRTKVYFFNWGRDGDVHFIIFPSCDIHITTDNSCLWANLSISNANSKRYSTI